jgi:hypothetical protein
VSGASEVRGGGAPTWWVVLVKELHELWVGGRALTLLLIYTLLLGIMTYVLATTSELSLIPAKEMVYEILRAAIAVGVFIGVVIGADSISGERERATLEGLLLTPTSRRQVIIGKFLAGASPWPAAYAVAIPYMWVLAQGDEAFGQALLWGAIIGTVLAPAFTAMGMFVSFWCNTNRTSLLVSLGIYVLFLVPTQVALRGPAGAFLQWVNPLQAPNLFLERVLVFSRTPADMLTWLLAPSVLAVLAYVLLFLYAGPGLRLAAGRAGSRWLRSGAGAVGLLLVGALLAVGVGPALALQAPEGAEIGTRAVPAAPLTLGIDTEYATVRAGEPVFYETTVTNHTSQPSPPLVLAINIINLDGSGPIVDPEDWSPERTQYLETLPAGGSATHSWRVNAIVDGDYMIYTVVLPEPPGQDATTQPAASPGIHLTVTPFRRINPGGVLPFALGGPVVVLLGLLYVYRRRNLEIDEGG